MDQAPGKDISINTALYKEFGITSNMGAAMTDPADTIKPTPLSKT